ncbi:MAG: hypothetical protein K0R06_1950 [Clostridium sp.]|nr:hypothetical protein [Clostridium sp.]
MMLVLTFTISSNVFAAPTTDESAELKQTQANKKQLQGKVDDLNKQIDDILKKVDNNKKDMNKIDQNIKNTQAKLEAVEKHSKEQEDLFKKRLRAIYVSGGGTNYLEVLLGSSSLSDFLSSMDSISIVMKYDNNIAAQLQEQQNNIAKKKEDLNSENAKLVALKASNESTLSNLSNDIGQQKQLLAKENEKENNLIAEQKAREAAEQAAAEKARELAAAQAAQAAQSAQATEKAQKLAAAQAANASKQVAVNKPASSNNSASTSSPVAINRGGNIGTPTNASSSMTMQATAYTDNGFTASGDRTKRDPNGYSTIAVDPRVIPLGSKVYVEGYGYAIASDTGGAIKGNIIDLFVPTDAEAQSWGRRTVTVHVVGN